MTSARVALRAARPHEAHALSELAFRSKAHWDYTAEQLDVFREELRLTPDDLARKVREALDT